MLTPIRVLIVEDSASDAKLMVNELRQAGFDPAWHRVDTETDYLTHLVPVPDLILSDFSMPQFNGLVALQHLRDRRLDVPFIFMSGTIDEDVGVQAMREGAADYLHKDRPARLGQAVRRALEQKGLREKNQVAEEQLRLQASALAAAANGILITDPSQPDNPIIYVNPAFEAITQYTAEEAIGRNCRFLQGKKTDPAVALQVREAVHAGQACKVELLNYRKDGTPFWNELSVSPVRDADGRLTNFIGIQSDITERKQLEAQFWQAQKMEAVGRLAGGVAHDFNNLLTIICGYGEILKGRLKPEDSLRPMIDQIALAGEKATMLTRQLLTFSHQHAHEVQQLDLNAIIGESEKLLARLIGEDIKIETRLAATLPSLLADPGNMNQILMNLAINARDAMPYGGCIFIETASVVRGAAAIDNSGRDRGGEWIVLTVTDTGCGMDEPTRLRIFEPFFTTKGVGKGTGIGLSTVHGIVTKNGGYIEVDSELGRGTTFRIYLRATSPGAHSIATQPKKTIRTGDGEIILLVEDEAAVRHLASQLLARCGYHVIDASSGPEALELAASHKEAIHLLLTDVVMPVMSGNVLADRMKAIHPETAILFMSGYTGEAITQHRVNEVGKFFLQKPFTPESLASKVRDVLDASAAAAQSE